MLAPVDLPASALALLARSRAAAAAIVASLGGAGERRRLKREEDLLGAGETGYALLHEGVLRLERGGRLVRFYDVGDLAPTGDRPELAGFRLFGEFATEALIVDAATLARAAAGDPVLIGRLLEHQSLEQAVLLTLAAALAGDDAAPDVSLREFSPGEVLVREGDAADALYQLVSGEALVTLGGVEIGCVGEEEFFGEVSLLAGVPRTSSVTALSEGVLQVVREPDLASLLQRRPRLALDLARGLARRLAAVDRALAATRG